MAMKPGIKMLLMDQVRQRPENNHSEYGGGNRRMIGYDREANGNASRANYSSMEGGSSYSNYGGNNRMEYGMEEPENRRRRDSRGRYMEGEGWQDKRGYDGEYDREEPESRRRRDSRGRYMMEGNEPEMRSQTWYPPANHYPTDPNYPMQYVPPNMMYGFGDVYAHVNAPNAMNRPMHGGAMGADMSKPVDEETARAWVGKMSEGEHFSPDHADQYRKSICPDCKKWEFYTAINAMYSDYCETAKIIGKDMAEFYAYLAKDFLKDKDAGPNKLRKYMETIPK